jgi:hypothetical protein
VNRHPVRYVSRPMELANRLRAMPAWKLLAILASVVVAGFIVLPPLIVQADRAILSTGDRIWIHNPDGQSEPFNNPELPWSGDVIAIDGDRVTVRNDNGQTGVFPRAAIYEF